MKKQHKKNKHNQVFHIFSVFFISTISFLAIAYIIFEPEVKAFNHEQPTIIKEKTTDLKTRLNASLDEKLQDIMDESQTKYTEQIDLENDASLQKYLGKDYPLNNSDFVPPDLEEINSEFVQIKAYRPVLRSPARIAFEQMAEAFYQEFGDKLIVVSAYRTSEDQANLKKYCSSRKCADTEESEHRIGLAVDIHIFTKYNVQKNMSKDSEYYKRLENNAYKFGFHNTFAKETENIIVEPRHRRYLGEYLATELHEKNISFGEYYQNTQN